MATLTTQQRKNLNKNDFVFPDKAPGSGSYPIPDESHARDALARASGKPEEGAVKAAVHKKFPSIGKPREGSAAEERAETPAQEKAEGAAGERAEAKKSSTSSFMNKMLRRKAGVRS